MINNPSGVELKNYPNYGGLFVHLLPLGSISCKEVHRDNKTCLLAFFVYHKTGTVWINSIIQAVSQEMWLKNSLVHQPEMFNHNLGEFINQKKLDCLSYTNADFEYVKQLSEFKGFHIVRDPRDIVISAYFSHFYSHKEVARFPELKEYRGNQLSLPKDEGLAIEMVEFRKRQFEIMYNWDYSVPNILEMKMEELVYNPHNKFLNI